jgi:hypothetical protein
MRRTRGGWDDYDASAFGCEPADIGAGDVVVVVHCGFAGGVFAWAVSSDIAGCDHCGCGDLRDLHFAGAAAWGWGAAELSGAVLVPLADKIVLLGSTAFIVLFVLLVKLL